MKRLLLNLLTTLSLLLLLLTIAQWTRSYFRVDDLFLGSHLNSSPLSASGYRMISHRGRLFFYIATTDVTRLSDLLVAHAVIVDLRATYRLSFETTDIEDHYQPMDDTTTAGFAYQKEPMRGSFDIGDATYTTISFPFYLPTLLFSLLPLHFRYRLRKAHSRKSRLAKNLCPTCSYDLRATPTRCPECGFTPSPPTTPPPEIS